MNSIILCEDSTDFVLLQYFMRKVYKWEDKKGQSPILKEQVKRSRILEKGRDSLTIVGCGGASRILPVFEYLLERNRLSAGDEAYDRIVMITDRDELLTEELFLAKMNEIISENKLQGNENLDNDTWTGYTYQNGQDREKMVVLLVLVIPFEETGAMETFLLNAIAKENPYDANIIRGCNSFVEDIDPEKRYLTKRRYVTKAKFDVYFSIRTAAEQFVERQNIIMKTDWENYKLVQKSFQKLGELQST